MKLRVHPKAAADVAAAVDWYERHRSGLGDEVEQGIFDPLDLVMERPLAWRLWPGLGDVRISPLDRFPFLLSNVIRGQSVVVLAVARANRRPGHWCSRAIGH